MRNIKLNTSSRLSATPLIQEDNNNVYYFGVWGKIDFPVTNRDRSKVLTERDVKNWANLAHDIYGDYNKMWVLWSANGISDPFNVAAGTRIRIPHPIDVDSVLNNIVRDAE